MSRRTETPEPPLSQHDWLPSATWEIALAFIALALFGFIGEATGWKGMSHTSTGTRFWPFYIDTWDTRTVWTVRALLPLVAIGPILFVLPGWFRRGGIGWLLALVGAA